MLPTTYTIFSDIDMAMGLNLKGDIAKKINENAIKQSVKNIAMCSKKLFNPSFGPRIDTLLFSLENPLTIGLLGDEIQSALLRNEPRISDARVEIKGDIDDNSVGLDIYFLIKEYEETAMVSLVIEKIRR